MSYSLNSLKGLYTGIYRVPAQGHNESLGCSSYGDHSLWAAHEGFPRDALKTCWSTVRH